MVLFANEPFLPKIQKIAFRSDIIFKVALFFNNNHEVVLKEAKLIYPNIETQH